MKDASEDSGSAMMIVDKLDSEDSEDFFPVRKQEKSYGQKFNRYIFPCFFSLLALWKSFHYYSNSMRIKSFQIHKRDTLVACSFWILALSGIGGKKNAKIQLTATKRLFTFFFFKECYEYVRNGVDGDYDLALRHADAIVWFESKLNLFFEHGFQAFIYNKFNGLIWWCNRYYEQNHFIHTLLGLMLNIIYGRFPNEIAFHTLNTMALVIFYNFPVCPPRLWTSDPSIQFIDTKNPNSIYSKSFMKEGNPFAAVPSMHCAWALWASVTQLDVTKNWKNRYIVKAWAYFHVVATFLVVVVTGNHWWTDAAIGWSLSVLALLSREKVATCLEVISFACGECILATPLGRLRYVESFFDESEDEQIELAKRRDFDS